MVLVTSATPARVRGRAVAAGTTAARRRAQVKHVDRLHGYAQCERARRAREPRGRELLAPHVDDGRVVVAARVRGRAVAESTTHPRAVEPEMSTSMGCTATRGARAPAVPASPAAAS